MLARFRLSTSLRALVLLLLVWVGTDIGLHGLVAEDHAPIPAAGHAVLRAATGDAAPHAAHCHCFCHAVSLGAVTSVPPARFGLVGDAVARPCPPAPHADRHPLDEPPRLVA